MREGREDALALSFAPRVGPVAYRELRARHGGAAHAARATLSPATLTELRQAARAMLDRAARAGAALWLQDDDEYPAPLLDLDDAPPYLFALGDARALDRPAVAIVGTRDASPSGERVTAEIARSIARAGGCVVSGLARGIDAAAHRGALSAGAPTAAVLGTGIDVPYPRAHSALHGEIAARGLVLSEHAPGERATPASFPRRNRLIAALARLTIVVEAGHKSGALITASHALELGRAVAAVPGPIDLAANAGSNALLRDGAHVIATPDDAVALVGLSPMKVPTAPPPGDPDELAVWQALASPVAGADALAARTTLPARRCFAALTALELAGRVECALTGEIRRR